MQLANLTLAESSIPSLNPYFQLSDDKCTGIWSEYIVDTLARTRPSAAFVEKAESFGELGIKDGQVSGAAGFTKPKPLSIKVSNYAALNAGGITIN